VAYRFPTSLLLAAVLSLSACASAGERAPAPAAPALSVRLDAAQLDDVARLLRMEDARLLDTALVARVLDDPESELRARAAVAAGRIRDRTATPHVLRGLADPDAGVRRRAAFALGELADSAAAVVSALAERVRQDEAAVAAEAAAALGLLGVESARAAIHDGLDRVAPVRHEALTAAWRLPRSQATTAAVLRWADHEDDETRWRAAYALMRIGGVDVVPALVRALGDAHELVRASAARGLRAAVVDSAGARQQAMTALLAAAADPHPHVRINAIRVLPGYREPARTTPLLLQRLDDEDANVVIATAQALAESGDRSAASALGTVARDPRRLDGVRSAALHSWSRLDSAAAARTAAAWTDSTRWILRLHGARALAGSSWAEAETPLSRLIRDSHYLVAAEAFAAIRSAADSTLDLRRLYIEGLGAAHPLVRAAAARGLGRAGAADLDVLLQAYERARQDSVRDAAVAAVDALGRAARAGAPVERAFFARFGNLGPPADAALRGAIADRIGAPPESWGRPSALPEPRPLDFYREIAVRLVAPAVAGGELPRVAIVTGHGEIVLELAAAEAPLTVHNFLSLVERGYYRGTRWHRVVPNFVVQDGDPRGDGSGGPGYAIRDEINPLRYLRGTVGMALSGPDTGGSQFFITHSPQPHLDGGYTVFGHVLEGMVVVDRVVQEDPITGFRRLR
jgi:cyclophilin family peptidyl-prolyl cis-trans isomerase/HEAT repeat protein